MTVRSFLCNKMDTFIHEYSLVFLFSTVDGGRRAVIFDKLNGGVQQMVIGEGTHFYIPFIQEPKILDVRSRPRTIHSATGTKDLQMVSHDKTCMYVLVYIN